MYVSTWKYFTQLMFLQHSITPVKTRPTPGVFAVSARQPLQGEPRADLDCTESLSTTGSEKEDDMPMINPKSAKSAAKSKETFETILLEKTMSVLQDISNNRKRPAAVEENGDSIFGKHVAQSLKGIKDKCTKEMVKLQVQQPRFNTEFESVMNQGNLLGNINLQYEYSK